MDGPLKPRGEVGAAGLRGDVAVTAPPVAEADEVTLGLLRGLSAAFCCWAAAAVWAAAWAVPRALVTEKAAVEIKGSFVGLVGFRIGAAPAAAAIDGGPLAISSADGIAAPPPVGDTRIAEFVRFVLIDPRLLLLAAANRWRSSSSTAAAKAEETAAMWPLRSRSAPPPLPRRVCCCCCGVGWLLTLLKGFPPACDCEVAN